ncbi:hypothetical protein QQX13_13250 [Demequina sp. SYSU T00068]|uniref:hypothetical protein n=1 Tax=Demequina lignilytica TaxID=3051663 RepID=UPI002628EBD8|nr:hypothetical protein [Demequina sp. SYSU T00068]MDN4491801.1 hypothetical protein [Demequina sp. SYSU T00068]
MTRTGRTHRGLTLVSAAVILVVAGCTGSGGAASPTSSAPPATEAPMPTSSASPAPTPGGETPAPAASSSSTADAGDDEFCTLMIDAMTAHRTAAEEVQAGLRLLLDKDAVAADDTAGVNAAGEAIVTYGTRSAALYAEGAAVVGDAGAAADLEAMVTFEELFTEPVGQALAGLDSLDGAAAEIAAVTADEAVQEAMTAAAEASPDLALYIADRCGIEVAESDLAPAGGLG